MILKRLEHEAAFVQNVVSARIPNFFEVGEKFKAEGKEYIVKRIVPSAYVEGVWNFHVAMV